MLKRHHSGMSVLKLLTRNLSVYHKRPFKLFISLVQFEVVMEFLSTVVPTLELHLPTLVTFQVHIASGARFIFKYVRHPHLKYTLQHDMYS